MGMFKDDEDPNSGNIELIRTRKDALEETARHLGLYLADWDPMIAAEKTESGEQITHGLMLAATFTVGKLALSKRVLDPDGEAFDAEFEAMVTEHTHEKAIDFTAGGGAEDLLKKLDEI